MPAAVSAWRGVARNIIPALVGQGLGSNAIINILRGFGLGYRRITMLADIRQVTGLARLERAVLGVAANVIFPQYGMVEGPLRRARRYRVYGRVTVEDVDTGAKEERMVSFYTDTRDSKEGWERSFLEETDVAGYGTGKRFAALTIASVEHQAGWGY